MKYTGNLPWFLVEPSGTVGVLCHPSGPKHGSTEPVCRSSHSYKSFNSVEVCDESGWLGRVSRSSSRPFRGRLGPWTPVICRTPGAVPWSRVGVRPYSPEHCSRDDVLCQARYTTTRGTPLGTPSGLSSVVS